MFWQRKRLKNIRRNFFFEQLIRRKQEISKMKGTGGSMRPKRVFGFFHVSRFWLKLRFWSLVAIGLLVGGSAVFFSFFSDSLKLQEVVIVNTSEKGESVSLSNLTEILKGSHLLTLKTNDLKRQILEQHLYEIQSLTIRRQFPSKLIIRYNPFPEALNFKIQQNNIERKFIVNERGLVISSDGENPELPYLEGPFSDFPKPKTLLLNPETVDQIVRSVTIFRDKFGMKVTTVLYKRKEREIHLKTEKGFLLWIDLTQNIERQLFKLKRALPKIDIYRWPLQYIDLRISGQTGDKVIFRRR